VAPDVWWATIREQAGSSGAEKVRSQGGVRAPGEHNSADDGMGLRNMKLRRVVTRRASGVGGLRLRCWLQWVVREKEMLSYANACVHVLLLTAANPSTRCTLGRCTFAYGASDCRGRVARRGKQGGKQSGIGGGCVTEARVCAGGL